MDAMTRAVVHGQAGELATAMVGIENVDNNECKWIHPRSFLDVFVYTRRLK